MHPIVRSQAQQRADDAAFQPGLGQEQYQKLVLSEQQPPVGFGKEVHVFSLLALHRGVVQLPDMVEVRGAWRHRHGDAGTLRPPH